MTRYGLVIRMVKMIRADHPYTYKKNPIKLGRHEELRDESVRTREMAIPQPQGLTLPIGKKLPLSEVD